MRSCGRIPWLCVLVVVFASCRAKPPVGFLGDLSGPSSELGTAGRDGARLYVEDQGFRLISCDSRNSPTDAARCVRALSDSGVRVVIGPMTSGVVDSAIAAARTAGLLLVSPTVSSHLLQGMDDPFLRVIGSNLDQADTLASLLVQNKIRHPLVLWERKNSVYTQAVAHRILLRWGASVDSLPFHSLGYLTSLDLSFDSVVAAHPEVDAFVLAGSAMDAGLLCKAMARNRSKARMFGSQFAMGTDLLRVGGGSAEGVVIAAAAPFADGDPRRKAFGRSFDARYKHLPSFGAAFGWEAAIVSRPGWKASSAEAAKLAILSSQAVAPLGDTLMMDRFGDVRRKVVAHAVRSGKFEILR